MTHSNGHFSDFAFINCMICLWYVHKTYVLLKMPTPINRQQMNNTSFCSKKCGLSWEKKYCFVNWRLSQLPFDMTKSRKIPQFIKIERVLTRREFLNIFIRAIHVFKDTKDPLPSLKSIYRTILVPSLGIFLILIPWCVMIYFSKDLFLSVLKPPAQWIISLKNAESHELYQFPFVL